MRKSTSLKRVFTVNFTLGLIIPVFLIGVVSTLISYSTVRDEIFRKNRLLSSFITATLQERLKQTRQELVIYKTFLEEKLADGKAVNLYLQNTVRAHESIVSAFILDKEGYVRYHWPHKESVIGTDRSGYDYYQNTQISGTSYWSPSFVSPQYQRLLSSLSIPMKDGVFTILLDVARIAGQIGKTANESKSTVAVVDQHGTYIVHTEPSKVLRGFSNPDFASLKREYTGTILEKQITYGGRQVICYFDFIEKDGWAVMVFQPVDEINRPLWLMVLSIIVVTLIVFLVALAVLSRQLRSILSVMGRLLTGVRKISEGNYAFRVKKEQYQELGELAERFNTMAQSVQSRENNLHKNQDQLEKAQRIAHLGYWEMSYDTNSMYWSKEIYRVLERDPEDFDGKFDSFLELIHPEDKDAVLSSYEKSHQTNTPKGVFSRIRRSSGEYCYVYHLFESVEETNSDIKTVGILQDISERRKAEEALMHSEKRFHTLFEDSPIAIEYYSSDGKLQEVNKTCLDLFGVSDAEEVIGFDLFEDPNISEEIISRLKNGDVVSYESEFDFEKVKELGLYSTSRSGIAYVGVTISPLILTGQKKTNGYLLNVQEITERKLAEEQIRSSLKEKETLLQEIHHRVKNNMQIIASLLKLQMNKQDDQQIKNVLRENQGRVYAMSAIHESLYQSENLSEIDFKSYLSNLIQMLLQTYAINPGKITYNIESPELKLNIDKANPLGLILNELISNSLKYAFPDDNKGEINIKLQELKEKEVELTIMDDGIGMPKDYEWENTYSLGLQLVRTLVENQLDGSIDMENTNGTRFTIKFNIGQI